MTLSDEVALTGGSGSGVVGRCQSAECRLNLEIDAARIADLLPYNGSAAAAGRGFVLASQHNARRAINLQIGSNGLA